MFHCSILTFFLSQLRWAMSYWTKSSEVKTFKFCCFLLTEEQATKNSASISNPFTLHPRAVLSLTAVVLAHPGMLMENILFFFFFNVYFSIHSWARSNVASCHKMHKQFIICNSSLDSCKTIRNQTFLPQKLSWNMLFSSKIDSYFRNHIP